MSIARGSASNLIGELLALGEMCGSQGDFGRAEQHYRLALSLYESSFPRQHTEAMLCLLRLMQVLENQGKLAEAEKLAQDIPELNMRRRIG